MNYPILHKDLSDKLKPINEYVIEVSKDNYWVCVVNRRNRDDKPIEVYDVYHYYDLENNLKLEKVYRKQMELYFDNQKFEEELSKYDSDVQRSIDIRNGNF